MAEVVGVGAGTARGGSAEIVGSGCHRCVAAAKKMTASMMAPMTNMTTMVTSYLGSVTDSPCLLRFLDHCSSVQKSTREGRSAIARSNTVAILRFMTNTNSKMTKILGDVEMVANPEVDGGLVSANEVPLDDARRMVRELAAAGFVADWAPAEKSEHSRDAYAWIYVGGAS